MLCNLIYLDEELRVLALVVLSSPAVAVLLYCSAALGWLYLQEFCLEDHEH